jgi:hypothetical protein
MIARDMPADPANLVLYGRYASPFVRRVAVTLRLYDIGYRHVPLMPFGWPGPTRRVTALIVPPRNEETITPSPATNSADDFSASRRARAKSDE